MLLTLSDHPHTGVSRETGTLCHIELIDCNQDSLGCTRQQVVEIKALSDVLLGNLVGKANIRLHEIVPGAIVRSGLSLSNQLDLLVFSENDCRGGECSKQIQHFSITSIECVAGTPKQ
jgi:hypothetical protein